MDFIKEPRYLAIRPENGLGNRLRSLISLKMIGDYLGVPTYVYWTKGLGFDDTELFELIDPDSLNVILINKSQWDKMRQESFKIDEHISGVREHSIETASTQVSEEHHARRAEYVENIFSGNHDKLSVRSSNFMPWAFYGSLVEKYMKEWWATYLRDMNNLRIHPSLENFCAPILEEFTKETYGLHIRRGDGVSPKNPNKEKYLEASIESFEVQIKKIISTIGPESKFYLSTDDPLILEGFKEKYGDKILYHDKKFVESKFNAPKGGQIDAMIDMWLLSKTDHVYGNFFSSFSRTASDLNWGNLSIVKEDLPSKASYLPARHISEAKIITGKCGDGVTLLTCSMNRNENLKIALDTWLNVPEIKEIIIVDWSSDKPVKSILPRDTYGKKIKVIEGRGQERWVLSWAFNLGAAFIATDNLLKIDADILLSTDFIKKHELKDGEFFHGTWRHARDDNELHLNGQLYCKTRDFELVNGYHEGITSYGWDDDDLYMRLINSGLKEKYLNNDQLHHLKTSNKDRASGQEEFKEVITATEDKALGDILFKETMKNRVWALDNPWGPNEKRKEWEITSKLETLFKQYYICEPKF